MVYTVVTRRGPALILQWILLLSRAPGFSVLQVQGPCPFRIEVTNSFVQPHPPPVSVSPETSTQSTTRTITNNEAKMYPPDPVSLLFGATAYETGRGGVGKQRAPINTTPSLPVSEILLEKK